MSSQRPRRAVLHDVANQSFDKSLTLSNISVPKLKLSRNPPVKNATTKVNDIGNEAKTADSQLQNATSDTGKVDGNTNRAEGTERQDRLAQVSASIPVQQEKNAARSNFASTANVQEQNTGIRNNPQSCAVKNQQQDDAARSHQDSAAIKNQKSNAVTRNQLEKGALLNNTVSKDEESNALKAAARSTHRLHAAHAELTQTFTSLRVRQRAPTEKNKQCDRGAAALAGKNVTCVDNTDEAQTVAPSETNQRKVCPNVALGNLNVDGNTDVPTSASPETKSNPDSSTFPCPDLKNGVHSDVPKGAPSDLTDLPDSSSANPPADVADDVPAPANPPADVADAVPAPARKAVRPLREAAVSTRRRCAAMAAASYSPVQEVPSKRARTRGACRKSAQTAADAEGDDAPGVLFPSDPNPIKYCADPKLENGEDVWSFMKNLANEAEAVLPQDDKRGKKAKKRKSVEEDERSLLQRLQASWGTNTYAEYLDKQLGGGPEDVQTTSEQDKKGTEGPKKADQEVKKRTGRGSQQLKPKSGNSSRKSAIKPPSKPTSQPLKPTAVTQAAATTQHTAQPTTATTVPPSTAQPLFTAAPLTTQPLFAAAPATAQPLFAAPPSTAQPLFQAAASTVQPPSECLVNGTKPGAAAPVLTSSSQTPARRTTRQQAGSPDAVLPVNDTAATPEAMVISPQPAEPRTAGAKFIAKISSKLGGTPLPGQAARGQAEQETAGAKFLAKISSKSNPNQQAVETETAAAKAVANVSSKSNPNEQAAETETAAAKLVTNVSSKSNSNKQPVETETAGAKFLAKMSSKLNPSADNADKAAAPAHAGALKAFSPRAAVTPVKHVLKSRTVTLGTRDTTGVSKSQMASEAKVRELQDSLKEQQQSLQAESKENAALKKELAALKSELNKKDGQLTKMQTDVSKRDSEIARLQALVKKEKDSHVATKKQLDAAQREAKQVQHYQKLYNDLNAKHMALEAKVKEYNQRVSKGVPLQ